MADPVATPPIALYAPAYPEAAWQVRARGDCHVIVTVDEAGNAGASDVRDCPELLVGATRDAVTRSVFAAEDAPDGVLTRTYALTFPFRLDPGFGHDWVMTGSVAGFGWCAFCADTGAFAENDALFGFGLRDDAIVSEAVIGWRAGGFEMGGGAVRALFPDGLATPTLELASTFVIGERSGVGVLPNYGSLRPGLGIAVQSRVLDRHGFGWRVDLHGGVDVRVGWNYYKELRPDVGLQVGWVFPAPGAKAALARANTPRVESVDRLFVPYVPPRPPPPVLPPHVPRPPAIALPAAIVPAELRDLGVAGTCRLLVDVDAEGIPTRAESLACPGPYAGPAEDAVMASRFSPVTDPASGSAIAVNFDVTYTFAAGGDGTPMLP